MKCLGCGHDAPTEFEFCGHCGSRLTSSGDSFAGDQLPFPVTAQPQFQNMVSLARPDASPPPLIPAQPPEERDAEPDNEDRPIPIAKHNSAAHPLSSSSSQSNPPATSFYREATEAIIMPAPSSGPLSSSGRLPSQQLYGFPGPTSANHQPFRPDDPYAPTLVSHPPIHARPFAPPQTNQPGYGYVNNSQALQGVSLKHRSSQGIGSRPLQKLPAQNTTPLVISICLVILVIIIISATIIYQGSQPQQSRFNGTHATGMTTPLHPTSANTLTPTATLAPTPVPDAGFIWCGTECAPNGFMDEYPLGWQMSTLMGNIGTQFINPQQTDQLVLLKTQDNPLSPADTLLMNELQNNYANQPGYQAPNPPGGQDATIGGETWSSASIVYQGSNQQAEQVSAYVTVHQGKAFILEVQSAQAQFAQVSTAYYNIMIGKFQFM